MSNSGIRAVGPRTDLPSWKDDLGVTPHVEGLARFIAGCATPLTIAIQGDWGSGKTSLMQMVSKQLPDSCHVVTFNTWQYAQFDMGDDLVLALMGHLIQALMIGDDSQTESSADREVRKAGAKLWATLMAIGKGAAGAALGMGAKSIPYGSEFLKLAEGAAEGYKEECKRQRQSEYITEQQIAAWRAELISYRGRTAVVERLHDQIAEYVSMALDARGAAKLVVLIDDLDRLEPERAVEVMEALKLFLDADRCVYVLAIDFDVVKRGVGAKFGDGLDEGKAIAFFDKIIQVPFHMPVHAYEVDEFLTDALGLWSLRVNEKRRYLELANYSVGNNPRSLKRLANTFSLLRSMPGAEQQAALPLFACLCLQSGYSQFYNEFVAVVLGLVESDDGDGLVGLYFDEVVSLLVPEDDSEEGVQDEERRAAALLRWGIDEIRVIKLVRCLERLRAIFTISGRKGERLDAAALGAVLKASTVTSRGSAADGEARIRKQDHTPNPAVQQVMRRLANQLIGDSVFDETAATNEIERWYELNDPIIVAGFRFDSVRLTRGKGQGLNLCILDNETNELVQEMYISGDAKGNIPNVGFGYVPVEGYPRTIPIGRWRADEVLVEDPCAERMADEVRDAVIELLEYWAENSQE